MVSRRDFLPFGEELYADGQSRTTANKFTTSGQDTVRKRFTGYEKDQETLLDFAEARMYENRYGRFTAVDPLLASGKSASPQTFNRYVYVMNNPLRFTDPTGLQVSQKSERVNTPMYVDSTGTIFSPTKDKQTSSPLTWTDYATMGGKNYQVDGKGYVEIGIPPPTKLSSGLRSDAYEIVAEAWAKTKVVVSPVAAAYSYIIDPLQDAWPAEHRRAAMQAVGPAAVTLAPFVIEGEIAAGIGGGAMRNFAFSQTSASLAFRNGPFAGKAVESISAGILRGEIAISEVQVTFLQRGGTNLIFDSRSATSLINARVPYSQWNLVNRTGVELFETELTKRLANNGLTEAGTQVIKFGESVIKLP